MSAHPDSVTPNRIFKAPAAAYLVREARPGDVADVLAIAKSCGVFTPDELLCLREDVHACLACEYVENGIPDQTRVLLHRDRIVAFAHFGFLIMTDRAWMVHWILVDRRAQGHGYGRAILKAVEQEVLNAHGRILFIETSGNAEFEPACAFYRRCGYQLNALVSDYYGPGNPKCVFSRPVGPSEVIAPRGT